MTFVPLGMVSVLSPEPNEPCVCAPMSPVAKVHCASMGIVCNVPSTCAWKIARPDAMVQRTRAVNVTVIVPVPTVVIPALIQRGSVGMTTVGLVAAVVGLPVTLIVPVLVAFEGRASALLP